MNKDIHNTEVKPDSTTVEYKGGRHVPEAQPVWQGQTTQQGNSTSKKEQ